MFSPQEMMRTFLIEESKERGSSIVIRNNSLHPDKRRYCLEMWFLKISWCPFLV